MRFVAGLAAIGLLCLAAIGLSYAAPLPPASQLLDDPVEPLVPKQARSEEEADRLQAIALFSTGRMFQQRRQYSEALRRYERALRYDPDAWSVLREMLPLAFGLERPDEGLRYAVKYAERNPIDARLLRRGAEYLYESGDLSGALTLCEQAARAAGEKAEPSADSIAQQVELGRLYFLTGRTAKSAAAFQQVLDALEQPWIFHLDAAKRRALLGKGNALYETMGGVFVAAKQFDAARTAFQQFDKTAQDAAGLAVNLARVEQAAGRPEETLAQLQKYLDAKASGKGIVPYEILEWALKQLKQEDQLITRLEALRDAQPENASLAYFLGKKYLDANQFDKAQELLQKSLAGQPSSQAFRDLAEVYRRTQQAGPLAKLLGRIVAETESLSLLSDASKSIAEDEKLLTATIDEARTQAADGSQEAGFVLRAVALLAAEAKRWDDVQALCNRAIDVQPKSAGEVLLMWGLGLFLEEKYPQAVTVLQRGVDEKGLADDNPAFYYYLASALEMDGKTDEALAAARTAAEKQPADPRFAIRPAWILYHAKRYDDAYKAYQAAVDQFGGDYESAEVRDILRQARLILSHLATIRKEIPQAVEWAEQVLDEFPDDPSANNDLGYLWAEENQHLNRAHRMIQLAVANEPENFAYRDSLGWVLFRLGRYGEALVELQKAAAEEEPDPIVLDHLGDTYAKLDRDADAREVWNRAVEGFKKAGEEEKMKAVEKKLADK